MDAANAYIGTVAAFALGFWLRGKDWVMRRKHDDERLDRALLQEVRALRCQVAAVQNEVRAIRQMVTALGHNVPQDVLDRLHAISAEVDQRAEALRVAVVENTPETKD